jgi:hypothetical protein
MPRPRILDTNVLINHGWRFGKNRTAGELKTHAEELIELQGTNLIVSPVLIEFLVGATSGEDFICTKRIWNRSRFWTKEKFPDKTGKRRSAWLNGYEKVADANMATV